MKLLTIQIALFPSDMLSRPDLVMNEINDRLGKLLDSMPNILNLPPDLAADIPVAQVKSSDNVYALNVAHRRVDLIITPSFSTDSTPQETFKTYKPIIDKYYKAVLNLASIKRIGIIFTLFEETPKNVGLIFQKYLKEEFSTSYNEVTVRTNKQNIIKGMACNNIQNVQSTVLQTAGNTHKGVVIQLDINNIPVNGTELSADFISAIMTHASGKIKSKALKELI